MTSRSCAPARTMRVGLITLAMVAGVASTDTANRRSDMRRRLIIPIWLHVDIAIHLDHEVPVTRLIRDRGRNVLIAVEYRLGRVRRHLACGAANLGDAKRAGRGRLVA